MGSSSKIGSRLGLAIAGIPLAAISTFLALPFWSLVENTLGVESVGHSGPALWCFVATYLVLLAIATTVWKGVRRDRKETLILAALIALGLAALIFLPGPRIESDGRTVYFVEKSVPVRSQIAYARLAADLQEELSHQQHFADARVVRYSGNRFPIQPEIDREAHDNPALERYARLGKEARELDFYVRGPFKDWPSEYLKNGKRADFNTDFLIHLSALDDGTTRIEVIEYAPRVTVGRNFRLCGRHLFPEITRDRRPVAPTTKDREEMLELAVRIASPAALDLLGLYHLPDRVDAVNLKLAQDGTFRWGIDGCDFADSDWGRWRATGDRLVLTPRPGKPTFTWVANGSFGNRFEKVELEAGDRSAEMIAIGVADGELADQIWTPGGVCVICEGYLGGPSGQERCAEPFL